ncbi:MAG: ascorbate-dependent monooxygenase [Terriglobia bacterium]|nr:MAG: ascorbate-dependent monooxygenase [Terriglobia bacterium]
MLSDWRKVFLVAPVFAFGSSGATLHNGPTFNTDVAPIIYEKCSRCHRPGEVAPFPLLTYNDVAKRAALIAAVVEKRIMPPWKPDPGPVPFLNEGRLSDEQIATIRAWATSGAPEGDPAKRPPEPHFSGGWQFGEPDMVLPMPTSVHIPAEGADVYRCLVLPVDALKDRYVSAFEFRPGNRRVVHHAILFVDTSGVARKLDAETPEPGYTCVGGVGFPPRSTLGVFAPGWPMPPLPAGMAKSIPKGADVIIQIHYHPSGKPEEDRSSLGLKFTSKPGKEIQTVYVYRRQLDIPAGDPHHVETFSSILPVDADLVSIGPHAHYIAKDLVVEAHLPDQSMIRLVHIADWDFNWQGFYYYERPIRLPKGTEIRLRYAYDNSDQNPHNPLHPPQRMTYGERTTDEMELAILGVAPVGGVDSDSFRRSLMLMQLRQLLQDNQDVTHIAETADTPRLKLLVRVFDRDHDGKLNESEERAMLNFLDWSSTHWPTIRAATIMVLLLVVSGISFLVFKGVRRLAVRAR